MNLKDWHNGVSEYPVADGVWSGAPHMYEQDAQHVLYPEEKLGPPKGLIRLDGCTTAK